MHFPFGASLQIHQNSSLFPSTISSHQVRYSWLCVNFSCHISFTFTLWHCICVVDSWVSLCQKKNVFWKLCALGNKRVFKLWFYVPVTWEIFTAHRVSFPIQSCECRANIFLSLQTLAVQLTGFFCFFVFGFFVEFFLCELLLNIKKATHSRRWVSSKFPVEVSW